MQTGSQTPEDFSPKAVHKMYSEDRFTQFLGIDLSKVEPGRCVLTMKVREDMLNGFKIVHGGVTFALGDSALAFASNSHGRLSVALEASISYPAPVHVGDTLTAIAEEISLSNRVGVYSIMITNQNNIKVAFFRGTVYRTSKQLSGD